MLGFSVILGILFIGFLVYLRVKDERYLKKPTREVLSREVRHTIEKEEAEATRIGNEFQKALRRATEKNR